MIGGLKKQATEINIVIELPIKHPALFESLAIAQPKGVLLYDPLGTGKILLACTMTHHMDFTFICISGIKLIQKCNGKGLPMFHCSDVGMQCCYLNPDLLHHKNTPIKQSRESCPVQGD
jgi:ATP-dependent 26S proteasome regulatory subunit